MTPPRTAVAALFLLLRLAVAAEAQTNERIYENLDFRFVTPGARAAGMGRAFVGLADDATAAYSNPGGLSNLLAKEFSVELQVTGIRHERLVSLSPGDPVQTRTFGNTVWEPSFLSFVWPLGRWTASFFLDSVQDYRESFAFQGRPVPALGAPEDGAYGTIAARNQQYGIGAAFVVDPRLSVGASIALSSLDLASEGRSGTPFNPRNGTNTIDSGSTVTTMAGILVKPRPRLSLGASFFGGASFDLQTTLFGTFLVGTTDDLAGVVQTGTRVPIRYVVPPRAALGVAWRPTDRVTVLADASHIWYSHQISSRFQIVDFQAQAFGLSPANFYVRDVWEMHVGAEYRVYGASETLAFRAGVFTDPDHRMRFRSTGPATVASTLLDFRFNTVGDKTDLGATGGIGLMIKNRFQLDVAGSLSKDARQLVVSTVVRP
jgi:long-chain fatty acid transport protein